MKARLPEGQFLDFAGERYYVIRNVDRMPPFFVSVISDADHWLFVSSTGGLTAGRTSPETALFPYTTVDKIHDSALTTGGKTIIRARNNGTSRNWEPFNSEHSGLYDVSRHLYKNFTGDKLCFEEANHDLDLTFRYTWATSDEFGFVRTSELINNSGKDSQIELLDGVQNILPAGTPRFAQSNTSNLVDAYKWTEIDKATGLALYSLYSGITDRAEPCESLKATTTFCLGLDSPAVLLSGDQLGSFRSGLQLQEETRKRGTRGAYFAVAEFSLPAGESHEWQIVSDIEKSQSECVALRQRLAGKEALATTINESIGRGNDTLIRTMASADGLQLVAEENVGTHHYANVLFNVLRGGIFDHHYNVPADDFRRTVRHFNSAVYQRHAKLLNDLPLTLSATELLNKVRAADDAQLLRLCSEYLPIRFGRRHGDPSRPWNLFKIKLQNDDGSRLLSYEGNWRDIFQNWEALTFSYPEFIESVIAKFVNASTMDGYNPYRITKEGIDWEVEEPDDPWSYIGYWGDHQIIYLLKLLELSSNFHPQRLSTMLFEPLYSYANVPYRIRDFEALLDNPKETVDFDEGLAATLDKRVKSIGADGKLVLNKDGDVYQVCLLEKLLIPLLAKLSNFVVGGGIWLNTQRPEWNDANNALVGQGLSMVTLYYMRRYIAFLAQLLEDQNQSFTLSAEVATWLDETAAAFADVRPHIESGEFDAVDRMQLLRRIGEAASRYRKTVYSQDGFSGQKQQVIAAVKSLLADAVSAIDVSIAVNRRDDGLYHAYNLLEASEDKIDIDSLYPMLEGQVAALSAGTLPPREVVQVVEALFQSTVYREDQQSFMLYPDRQLPGFLEKNRVSDFQIKQIPLLGELLESGDTRLIERDADGRTRFNADFKNAADVETCLAGMRADYPQQLDQQADAITQLYEEIFDHQAFTGRSGTMFGFEGLGSIYWHMVAKLLLAVQENFFDALENHDGDASPELGSLYYRVRQGIGFNKTPSEYGAFPNDPYSHTPKHAGARQPGMTGQVKEEVLTRFGELGVRVSNGTVRFMPALLRAREFLGESVPFRYLDIDNEWQIIDVAESALAFTWCQLPIVYRLGNGDTPALSITRADGSVTTQPELTLSNPDSKGIFMRSGSIRLIELTLPSDMLFAE